MTGQLQMRGRCDFFSMFSRRVFSVSRATASVTTARTGSPLVAYTSTHTFCRLLHCSPKFSRARNLLSRPRYFSSGPPTGTAITDFPLNEFHHLADSELEHMMDSLGILEDTLDDVDISFSQGILKIDLGTQGCWVINKQTPNRQLWWSSPLSGPRRYDYEPASVDGSRHAGWYVLKNLDKEGNVQALGDDMFTTLQNEMHTTTGLLIDVTRDDDN